MITCRPSGNAMVVPDSPGCIFSSLTRALASVRYADRSSRMLEVSTRATKARAR